MQANQFNFFYFHTGAFHSQMESKRYETPEIEAHQNKQNGVSPHAYVNDNHAYVNDNHADAPSSVDINVPSSPTENNTNL